ncbi:MAG: 23S rRNA (guanosine(2251)-2'-O)-methyltransferase RlmB [Gammaproteobacteria bacterium]|nr:23S rRNA (guanosine(2251)-2'-O)-methyltransferase RlmB [Chromatiales bacterium]MCP4924743.1 23S rRNA (guanosine(2251)-2'-O)-methyltransferase RlmB [Gammaproteobacteria bacterium]MDP7297167.1 23S rRNA (guanosine(2251)-2'-O)-methyltransferase RlmB [Gammaproteobacteria bacterium]MDP7419126.1 23S rRNA (guanosine(2251)-2'-O)-methyltransferase RlmB [Gammaproteobacteria bacterium]MDP7659994.1 23S rRNA (guanosine(2251)-2'-O)-methyltransferase RlmB [Gammaproteobacteria bacterium]
MKRRQSQAEPRVIYGINAVGALLARAPERVLKVYLQQNLGTKRFERIGERLEHAAAEVRRVAAARLDELTGTAKHQGVAALVSPSIMLGEAEAREHIEKLEQPLLLVLDGIEDPRNFGACLRSADAAGVDLVVMARSRGVGMTATVSKVAAGAAETQLVAQVGNLVRFMDGMRDAGIWMVGTDGAAEMTLFNTDLNQPVGLVLGAEGRGLRRLTREHCDTLVSLPMVGSVESLNISVAAGVCLYEAVRQRGGG